MFRSSGILMPMSSLPSSYGIGTMGQEAYKLVDFLAEAGQCWWQLLPLGPTSYGDSPYASPSSYAGNPYYIDLEMLVADKLLLKSEIKKINWGSNPEMVDYGAVYQSRFKLLRKAFSRASSSLKEQVQLFRMENARWLENYAIYMSVKEHFKMKPWTDWDDDIRLRAPEAVEKYKQLLKPDIDFWCFVQYLFFKQWNSLREYAHEKGIGFIGDVPIYVAMDSADVWSEPEFFQLDDQCVPTEVSGVPPDDFTEDGQLWGNPLYNWEKMRADGFGWWIRRIDGSAKLFDVIRIDHFRGLASYWAVPYGDKTAKNGRWRQGPGIDFVRVLTGWFSNLEYIAEDLGYPTEDVTTLLNQSGLPGMNVLQFGFDPDGDSAYMPHNIKINSTCYVGTHDNHTTLGWLETLNEENLQFIKDYTHYTGDESWCRLLIRTGMATPSKLFVLTMQDLLELPASCRMNTPGNPEGNWTWRMKPGALTPALARELRNLTMLYRRMPLKHEKTSGDKENRAAGNKSE